MMTTENTTLQTRQWLQESVKPSIDERIQEIFANEYSNDKLWYQLDSGGKRLRPGLVLLVSRLCGLQRETALDIACGAELLHTFSLVHDDVMDRDRYRRSQKAMWNKYGINEAINIGDLLYTHGLLILPDAVTNRACSTVKQMSTGQQMEFGFEERRDVTVDEYMTMVKYKTGVLFEFCVTAPLEMADSSLDLDQLQWIGPAFQIRDDLLDFESGKGREETGNDVKAGKRTVMAIHADDDRVYDLLDKPYEETSSEDVQEVMDIFEESGSFEYATQKMHSLTDRVSEVIDSLPSCEETDRLQDIRSFVVNRTV